jgi:phenylacetate-CoA ligase
MMSEFVLAKPELSELQLEIARKLLAQLRSVPELAARYTDLSTVDGLDDLARVPVIFKEDLQAAVTHLNPKAQDAATWIFQSGGSTGAPQVGHSPTGLYMEEVYEHWKALERHDIFVNGWSAGKMWGAHFLANCYIDHAKCTAMNVGGLAKAEYDAWLEFFKNYKVTGYGGTPSVLRAIFGHAREHGHVLPDLKKVLWLGEGWDPQLDEDLAVAAPNAKRWGMFGSTETWVVATNTPDCPADTWHPLPSQVVYVGDDEMLDFTSLKPSGLNPVLRYRTGDAGRVVQCTCGRPGPALQVLGRRDGLVKFRGHLLNVDDFVADVGRHPGVSRAQLVVKDFPDGRVVLEVLLLAAHDASAQLDSEVREHIVGSAFGPSVVFQRQPDALEVTVAESLIGNERTGKIPNLVKRQVS